MADITEPIENKIFKTLEPMFLKWLKDQGVKHVDYGDSFVEWHHRGYNFELRLKQKK